ncbi:MAG: hypothetical protein Q9217_001618 [Psora testacea]
MSVAERGGGNLFLIPVRASEETTFTCVGHPLSKDVENATIYYRSSSSKLHKEILGLVPKRNLMKSFRSNKARLGLEETLHRWKEVITKDMNPNPLDRSSKKSSSSYRTLVGADIEEMNEICKATKLSEEVAARESVGLSEHSDAKPGQW